jgi:hypothetical protein
MMPRLPLSRNSAELRFDASVICVLLTVSLIPVLYLGDITLNDPFVTYRYARNVHQRMGLVYNAGAHVQSTTLLLTLVLAALAWLSQRLAKPEQWARNSPISVWLAAQG